jgi:hypothetical protein
MFQMVLVAISGALLGGVFGHRFKVLVLLPAILVGVLSIAVVGIAGGTAISTIVLDTIAWTCALQFGYLGGLFNRFIMGAARARRMPQSSSLAGAPH